MHCTRFEMQSSNRTNALRKIYHKKHGRWGDSKKDHSPTQRDQGSYKDASASKKYIQAPTQRQMGIYAQSGGYWFLSDCSISQNV